MKEILLAGTNSGSGKTTLSLGLIKALMNRGLVVQPYKVGPDYVDTGFHSRLCDRDSINLDEFMVEDDRVLADLYSRSLEGSDIAITEGVMGFYDGLGTDKLKSSSAGMALKLGLPVVLIMDGSGMATSAAAIVKGFADLEPRINIAGLIVNKLSSDSHYQIIKKAVEKYTDVRVLGYVKKDKEVAIPSQKKGLVPEKTKEELFAKVARLAEEMEETIDMDLLLQIAETGEGEAPCQASLETFHKKDGQGLSLAYAYDEAFNFYYPDNLRLLRERGLDLKTFSPLHDEDLVEADAYYIGGGYIFENAQDLSQNTRVLEGLYRAYQEERPILAEGEGLLYLGKDLDVDGKAYPMVGVFEGRGFKTQSLANFGYSTMTLIKPSILGQADQAIRGHQYHYSDFETHEETIGDFAKTREGKTTKRWKGVYQKKRTLGTFEHIHFYQDPSIIDHLIQAILESKGEI